MHQNKLQALRDMRRAYGYLPSSFAETFLKGMEGEFAHYYEGERASQSLPPLPGEPCPEILDE